MLTGTAAAFAGCTGSQNGGSTQQANDGKFMLADKVADGAILQAFCWDFNTISRSMADIAAAGFSAVQTSPINACLEGEDGGMELYGDGKWYYHYQPTDFKIGNYQLGSKEEFTAMCAEAEKYGVKVLVDVIANHTTPQYDAIAEDLIQAGGGSLELLYHQHNNKDITHWDDRLECTTAKMGGLPDINTERPSFQEYFLEFINDTISCGADGFRYDTAKHIGLPDDPKEDDGFTNNFWERVTTEVDNHENLFIYGEVLQGGKDRLADYINTIGRTTSSTYGGKIRESVTTNNVNSSMVGDYFIGSSDPAKVVTWVESHDNYINDSSWMSLDKDHVILGWAIITARKDGTPLFFSRPYMSNIDNIWGMNRIGTQGDDMYKDARVSAVNFFRTAMNGEKETLINPNSDSSILMIERGTKGAVIVNTSGEKSVDFETNLKDGTYTDRVDRTTQYTVKGGKLTCESKLAENSVVVLYNDGYQEYAPCANTGVAEDTQFVTAADSYELTLTLENAEEGTVTIDGAEKTFKNGDTVTLKKPSDGEVAVAELSAKNEKGIPTYERIEITFREDYEITKGTKVYFEKPDDWGDKIYAYVYDRAENENAVWPGKEMTKESDGTYSYEMTRKWKSPRIIFNDGADDGSDQYPEKKGLKVEADKTYKVE